MTDATTFDDETSTHIQKFNEAFVEFGQSLSTKNFESTVAAAVKMRAATDYIPFGRCKAYQEVVSTLGGIVFDQCSGKDGRSSVERPRSCHTNSWFKAHVRQEGMQSGRLGYV